MTDHTPKAEMPGKPRRFTIFLCDKQNAVQEFDCSDDRSCRYCREVILVMPVAEHKSKIEKAIIAIKVLRSVLDAASLTAGVEAADALLLELGVKA